MSTSDCFLGIDLGTSSIKFCVIDHVGTIKSFCKIPLPEPSSSGSENGPIEDWQKAIHLGMTQLQITTTLQSLRAISLDATSGTVMLCNQQGHVISEVLFYDDARATDNEMQQIYNSSAPEWSAVQARTSGLAKLLWFQHHPPKGNPEFCMHQADWLLHLLTGKLGLTDENNALKLGYDAQKECWPEWLSDCLGAYSNLLPKVVAPGTFVAPLEAGFRKRFDLTERVEVYTGTTDSIAAVMASGVKHPGEAVTSLGSTLVLKVISKFPVNDGQLGLYSHRFGKYWLVGGASNSGGRVLSQFFDTEDLQRLSKRIDTDCPSGLRYYPLPSVGERFPANDPEKKTMITPRPDEPEKFLQALLEGMARIEAQGYRVLAQQGAPAIKRVISVGGGACNAAWTRIRERILGVPVLQAEHQEASYGCALLARKGWLHRHHPPVSGSVD